MTVAVIVAVAGSEDSSLKRLGAPGIGRAVEAALVGYRVAGAAAIFCLAHRETGEGGRTVGWKRCRCAAVVMGYAQDRRGGGEVAKVRDAAVRRWGLGIT